MLFPTSLVGSYPQPDWLIDRERLAHRFPPRVRALELWRVGPGLPGAGPGRRHAAGHPGAGGRRAGHHHRRRDAPGELLQPVRDRAGRRGHRQPGHRAGPQRPPQPGAADHRADPPPSPGRGRRPGVPARAHRPDRQDHRARAVHHGPAGAERLLPEPGGGRVRLRRGGQRRGPGPVRGRRGRRPAGRAVPAGPAGAGPRLRDRGAEPGAGRDHRARPRCTSASATRRSSTTARRATRSCPSWPRPAATRSRSRPRSPGSTARCWPRWTARRSSWASWT